MDTLSVHSHDVQYYIIRKLVGCRLTTKKYRAREI